MGWHAINRFSVPICLVSCLLLTGCFASFASTKPKISTQPIEWPTKSDFRGVLFVLRSDHVSDIGKIMASTYPHAFVSINNGEKDLVLHAGEVSEGTKEWARIDGSPVIYIDLEHKPMRRRRVDTALNIANLGLVFPLPIPVENTRALNASVDSYYGVSIKATPNKTVCYGLIWHPIAMLFTRDSHPVIPSGPPIRRKSRPEEWIEYFPELLIQPEILGAANPVTSEGYWLRIAWFDSLEPL